MKDNRGVTLIELIIVMLIMAILAGGAMIGIRSLSTGSAKNTTNRINSLLDKVCVDNMTKKEIYYLVIEESGGKYFISVQTGVEPLRKLISKEQLDLRDGEITYQKSGDIIDYLVSSTPVVGRDVKAELEVCFQKDTGGILANSDGEVIAKIGVTSSGRSYSIRLVTTTGKHYIE